MDDAQLNYWAVAGSQLATNVFFSYYLDLKQSKIKQLI